ncbi:MAG: ABC transporter [Cellulomonas sp.]|uniref:GTPase domain-containing protein n=1 Tax=Cellulomonas sp. 73-92 TaxID=1895740 RepID=UPI0009280B23|nr:GTPase domain-containing protein [Cellulomonas sp. 73-92]MBN9374019.1 ABC transporter [Cellulomonas sp.]OJV78837.1 MAG: ABC transporter [Cellulomonas sp. 73-92]
MTEGARPADAALVTSLNELRELLAALRLPLQTPGVVAARADRQAAVFQLDAYVLPRLAAPAAPLLVVVGGSTGAGKSTLVNSLLGEEVSAPGVLRPTTRSPVLVHHPQDGPWYGGQGAASLPSGVRLVASAALPPGLALLDAPDIDSVEEANRALAERLLAAADLWLFVTTAARYADAVPWALLRGAALRHAQVALVVDRVDRGAEAVVDDLRRLMDGNDLAGAPLFVLPETELAEGLLPEEVVGPIARWLSELGADAPARRAVAQATRDGVVEDLVRRGLALARAADEQVVADERLRRVVERRYAEAVARVEAVTSDGAMLRGEVLSRWQELVGTGELFRSIEQGVGRLRDRLTDLVRGRPAQPRVEQAIASGLEGVLLDAADEAAERTHAAWRTDPAGGPLVVGADLARSSAGLRAGAAEQVRGWQGDVLELVREQGASRRGTARYLSFGVNAAGVALMVVAFASTGGLTGVEVGIAGGTAVVAQKLLEAVFGDDAVRRLTTLARERLDERVRLVLGAEAARYTALLHAHGAIAGGDALRAAAHAVEVAAHDERSARPAAETPRRGAATVLRGAGGGRDGGPGPGGLWRRLFGRGRR